MKLRLNMDQLYVFMIALPCVFLAASYFVPVLNVLRLSVTEPELGFGNYQELLGNSTLHQVFINTVNISLVTTVLTLVLGYMVALGLLTMRGRGGSIVLAIVLASFWLSALIRAYAWIAILNWDGLVNQLMISIGIIDQPLQLVRNEIGVVIGMVHYMLPYAILPLYANLSGIDKSLTSAARALGANRWRSFWWVFFPQSIPGLAGAGILVFIFSLGFYVTPQILGGGRVVMVAQYIAQQISVTLRWGLAAMLATVLVLVVLVLVAFLGRYLQFGSIVKPREK